MKALRRALSAPWLWLGLATLQIAIAAAIAAPVRAVLRSAMGPFTIGDEAQLLGPLFELLAHNPAVSAALVASLAVSGALGLLLAPLLAGAVIIRLSGPCNIGEQARASVSHFPAALVIGIYGLILRVLLALVAVFVHRLFALAHASVAAPHALPTLFVLSLGFGLALERTGKLWVSVLMHAGFNAMNVWMAAG